MERIRILIADDHPVFRYGLRTLLQAEAIFEVVGEATTGQEAIDKVATLRPDVILMDLSMPEINGIEATRRILAMAPQTKILVLTMFDDDDSVFAAMRTGARGYILKGAEGDETIRAIHVVSSGEAIFSPAYAVLWRAAANTFYAGISPIDGAGTRGPGFDWAGLYQQCYCRATRLEPKDGAKSCLYYF